MGVKVREKPKGSGNWWIFINHHGKRMSRTAGKNEKIAKEAAQYIESQLLLGDLGIFNEKKQTPTLGKGVKTIGA